MKKLLFAVSALAALSLLAPSSGLAQPYYNQIGLYTDVEATMPGVETAGVGDMVTAYVIVTNPYNIDTMTPLPALGGVEFNLAAPAGVTVLSLTWPVDVINVGNNTDVIAGFGQPLSVDNGMAVLCTYTFFVMSTDPQEFFLGPFSVPSIPDVMVLLDSTEDIHAAYPSSGAWDAPVFGINTVPTATEPTTLDNVKALYR
jgi:hypothetical protein